MTQEIESVPLEERWPAGFDTGELDVEPLVGLFAG